MLGRIRVHLSVVKQVTYELSIPNINIYVYIVLVLEIRYHLPTHIAAIRNDNRITNMVLHKLNRLVCLLVVHRTIETQQLFVIIIKILTF